MTDWPKDNEAALDAFYTRPDGSAKWEIQNLVYITAPWTIYLAGTKIELKRGIRIHKKVADDLTAIFNEIWAYYGKTQAAIEKVDLHQFGGAYYFRARRGSSRLSNHARGIALDLDPMSNEMRKGNRGDIPQAVITIFENHGWRWGGVYGDPMHFEAVWNGKAAVKPPVPTKASPTPSKSSTGPWITAAVALIKRWEGFRATRYWDVKQWAIGYGQETMLPADATITEAQASAMLADYLSGLAIKVAPLITAPITANQGGALLSFAYNLGVDALAKSTLLRKVNAKDATAADEFGKWVKAGGKVLAGLVKRREAEKQLFLS